MTLQDEWNVRANALDVLIEQERQLIAYYEARSARAEATAAAAVTAVFALAALTATPATSSNNAFAWIIVVLLAFACVFALVARTVAGLKRSRDSWFSSGSDKFDTALEKLRECHGADPEPVDARQRTLTVCAARATDARETAKSRDRAATVASAALALALVGILVLRLLTA